jgi:hypothetical protein
LVREILTVPQVFRDLKKRTFLNRLFYLIFYSKDYYGKKDVAKLALAEASGEAEDAVDFSEFEDSDNNNEATSDQQEPEKESSTSKKSPVKGKSSKSKRSPLEEALAPKVPAESAPLEAAAAPSSRDSSKKTKSGVKDEKDSDVDSDSDGDSDDGH